MSVDMTVPEVRFKGFSGDWEENHLSKFISSLDAGVSVNSGDKPADDGEFGILKTSCVTNGIFDPNENKVVSDTREINRLKESVLKNTIIISRMNTPDLVGANAYIDRNFLNYFLPDRLWAAKPTTFGDLRFIANILGSDRGREALSGLATGTSGSMKNISKPSVLRLKFHAPIESEQTKIGNTFQKLDSLINQHQQKHDKLSSIKKAMLEKMFPKQGETTPEIRFKGFSGEWLSNPIGEICGVTFGGGTPSTNEKNFWQGEIPWIQSSDIKDGSVSSVTAKKYITKAAVSKSATKLISGNTIAIVTRVGVGKLSLMQSEYATSQDFLSLSDLNINSQYAVYVIWKQLQIEKEQVQGTSIKGITKDELLGKFISYPESKEEQTKVGNYFQKLDALINQHQQQITKLNNIKQACLSKMFV
ncbi:restriction endonuclease subunit S [Psychromonas antarctica]|uniref:restriction endonuclease subunit S n=1 Tax=Psychromonas antarctica TaxID=67573 RepID=UPI001EE83E56|nr:restriction endonuclease subunit S [Psychromonas antarctica]MCG6202308.1 restriction endonuclease subunit S [Psychromonas antarctica]